MDNQIPISISDFMKKRNDILKLENKGKGNQSFLDKLALWITEHVGSMGFFLIIFIWTAIWLGWNMFASKEARFDPYPGFVLWLFISNMIQLFLMPLIMIGQNIQSRNTDIRSETDLKINLQAELETETILEHLEYQNKMIVKILEQIENK